MLGRTGVYGLPFIAGAPCSGLPEWIHARVEQFIRARARSVAGLGEPSGADSNMKIACVLVTHLRAKVEMRRQPHLKDRPAVIIGRSRGKPVVIDHFQAATGVVAGMTAEQALSRQADGILLEADEAAYRRAFRRMLLSLQGVSDRVEGGRGQVSRLRRCPLRPTSGRGAGSPGRGRFPVSPPGGLPTHTPRNPRGTAPLRPCTPWATWPL